MPMSLAITTRHTFGIHESEQTTYVQHDRSRVEFRASHGRVGDDAVVVQTTGPRLAIVCRCDLGQMFSLDLDAGDYESCRLAKFNSRSHWLRAIRFFVVHPWRTWKETRKRPPTVLVETTTIDTGERKDMFGFTARRVITTEHHKPLPPSTGHASATTTDGWYIDIDSTIACERLPPGSRAFLSVQQVGQPPEILQFKDIGSRETGHPVDVTTVHSVNTTLPDGTPQTLTTTSRTQVTHLSTDPLDASLFEIPAGFRKRG